MAKPLCRQCCCAGRVRHAAGRTHAKYRQRDLAHGGTIALKSLGLDKGRLPALPRLPSPPGYSAYNQRVTGQSVPERSAGPEAWALTHQRTDLSDRQAALRADFLPRSGQDARRSAVSDVFLPGIRWPSGRSSGRALSDLCPSVGTCLRCRQPDSAKLTPWQGLQGGRRSSRAHRRWRRKSRGLQGTAEAFSSRPRGESDLGHAFRRRRPRRARNVSGPVCGA